MENYKALFIFEVAKERSKKACGKICQKIRNTGANVMGLVIIQHEI